MRKQGHKLSTTWNGKRGDDAVTTGICICKKFRSLGASQVAVRAEYQKHVDAETRKAKKAAAAPAKKTPAKKKAPAKKAAAKAPAAKG